MSSPKPIAFMTTFKLHQNLMKSELYGSPLDKWGNGANLMGQIWDSDMSGSAFQSPHSCQQYPGWGHWASSTVTGIYYTHPPPPHPCAWLLPSQNEIQVPPLPLPQSWSGKRHQLGRSGTVAWAGLGGSKSIYALPTSLLRPSLPGTVGPPPKTPIREESTNVNTLVFSQIRVFTEY